MKYIIIGAITAFLFFAVFYSVARSAWCSAERLDLMYPVFYTVALTFPVFLGLFNTFSVKPRLDLLKAGRSVPSSVASILSERETVESIPMIWIGYVDDAEAMQLASRIRDAFEQAGWITQGNQPSRPVSDEFKGIQFTAVAGPSDPMLKVLHQNRQDAVRSALRSIGERYQEIPNPSDSGGADIGSIVVGSLTCDYPVKME